MSENDSFLGQGSDRYYTNGFFLYYHKAVDPSRFKSKNLANVIFGLELGQKIFNARSGALPDARYVDRPIAGYLYVSVSENRLYKNEINLKLTGSLAVVGPASGGEVIQNFIHDTFGFYRLNSWPYQVQNDFQLNLNAEGNRLLARTSWADLSLSGYARLGTGFTGAGIGTLIRLGNFNPLYRSVSTQSTASFNEDQPLLHKREFFFYSKPAVHAVLFDATIQGSLFRDHPVAGTEEITTSKEPVLWCNQMGLSYAGSRMIVNLGVTIESSDTKQAEKDTHQWGSVGLMYRFN
ncbi:lipid A deacylase LpxR family protein [Mucilaginibacter hurinus]|uniref:Lipid A deacylase LpxR family protein n=2 Tax=Mucilaginibacter hurinus TaxID=2201324 RepID=A0A367GVI8_9SPHI|nr:lipid A deacylase LpxR family protein [Mucilaginibacter hurinus]